MKNLYLLPTDKPSRLLKKESDSKLILYNKLHYNERFLYLKTQNIYITSDKEIKEGNWCLIDNNVGQSTEYSILKCLKADVQNGEYLFQDKDGDKFTTGRCNKIILTTDQDLIKDGVQTIDNEFLEWFSVKNPSCEKVKVELHVGSLRWSDSKNTYKIIIPKEEPKHRYNNLNYGGGFTEEDIKRVSIRQETLEDISKSIYPTWYDDYEEGIKRYAWLKGAKWQAEKMYSEEEVLKLLEALRQSNFNLLSTEEWFKKNKNKL